MERAGGRPGKRHPGRPGGGENSLFPGSESAATAPTISARRKSGIIIEKGVTGSAAWTRFFTQLTSAFRFDWLGDEVNMTFVLNKLRDADRDVREMAWRKLTDKLRDKSMELTFIFNTLALDKANSDRRRGYASWISSRNLSNKASDEVVEALVATVTGNYDLVARHYRLKRRLLGYEELYDYDRYAPLNLKESEAFYVWDQARDVVLKAFDKFSPRMETVARRSSMKAGFTRPSCRTSGAALSRRRRWRPPIPTFS